MHESSTAHSLENSWDPTWQTIRDELENELVQEPVLTRFFHAMVLDHATFESSLSAILAEKLRSSDLKAASLREIFGDVFSSSAGIIDAARSDLRAVRERDPATSALSQPLLYYKGFHALQAYRVSHWLWTASRKALALHLQNRISQILAVDIHPAAQIGAGIMIDHATSVVIGETAVIANNVSILHEVTLGGTGKETGDRHPKIREGVLIGAGAKLLGNIEVGAGAKIGAGSVVLHDVPPHCTVAGVPAVVVGCPESDQPALEMDHTLPAPDRR